MKKKEYKALCSACGRLLQSPHSSDERIAIPFLHVIRPHPVFMLGYTDIFHPKRLLNLKRRILNFAHGFRNVSKALVGSGQPWSPIGELPSKCDLLIVSHLLNDTFPNQEHDFYYGKAADEMIDQGYSVTIALINHTNIAPSRLASSWGRSNVSRVILNPALSLACELRLYWRIFTAARDLKTASGFQLNELECRVRSRAVVESFSGGTLFALRLGEQIKSLIERLSPRAIVVTHEGHSWERIAFDAARKVSPKIRCIGYQHATLFNLQHALQRNLVDRYNPDVILTSGQVSRRILEMNPKLKNVIIKTLGSARCFSRKSAFIGEKSINRKTYCLVLPDGDVNECSLLFKYSLACARAMPSLEFIWRLHPIISFRTLFKGNAEFQDMPSNIILSENALAEDIAQSDWALYRGSSAIVQAVVSGVRPVYLHQNGEILIDTLYEAAEFRPQVVVPEDFKRLVLETHVADIKLKELQDFCEQMFTPMNVDVLIDVINDA